MTANKNPVSFEDFAIAYKEVLTPRRDHMSKVKHQRTKKDHKPPWEKNMRKGNHPKSQTFKLYGESSTIYFKINKARKVSVFQEYDGNDQTKTIHHNISIPDARLVWKTFTRMGWETRDWKQLEIENENFWYSHHY